MVPQDVHILILEPVNVTFYGKMDFADVIKLRLLKWEIILDYPGGPM
jgi:hypothetical protein